MPEFHYYHDWNLNNRDLARTLELYLMHGYTPGGFVSAVLAGDLFGAVAKADHYNRPAIAEIVEEIQYICPAHSYGSYEAVKEWCYDVNGRRSRYAEYMREKKIIEKLQSVT